MRLKTENHNSVKKEAEPENLNFVSKEAAY